MIIEERDSKYKGGKNFKKERFKYIILGGYFER